MRKQPTAERLWAKVDRRGRDECWPWIGATTGDGYGRITISGSAAKVLVHRLAYELLVGPIPGGLTIDHLCRNRVCCNPAHMEPVTRAENTLRGVSPSAQYARRTHCAKGHPLTGDNLRIAARGERVCVTCKRRADRAAMRRYRARQRALAPRHGT